MRGSSRFLSRFSYISGIFWRCWDGFKLNVLLRFPERHGNRRRISILSPKEESPERSFNATFDAEPCIWGGQEIEELLWLS